MGAGEEILKALARVEAKLDRVLAAQASGGGGGSLPIADDRDLDGQHGDPAIKFTPKRGYSGPDMKGQRMSEASPEFLDAYADALQYASEHPREGKEKYARYDALDAARARGWAKRLRGGWRNPAQQDAAPATDDDTGAPF